jgi:hypothetical protein
MTVIATKIDSSHESGKNLITWAWPASTTIIYNNLYNETTRFYMPKKSIRPSLIGKNQSCRKCLQKL